MNCVFGLAIFAPPGSISSNASNAGKIMTACNLNTMKRLRSVVVLCASSGAMSLALAATPASATEFFVQSDGIYNPGTATISGPLIDVYAYSGPLVFDGNIGVGANGSTRQVIGFCVDIFHDITAGINSQQALNLQYHSATLTTDSNGGQLSATQIAEVGGLADLGFGLYRLGDPDLSNKLAGVQGAIWQILNPTYTVTGGSSAISTYIADYVAHAPLATGPVLTMYADNFATQGFAISAAIPEPGTWAMLIAGMIVVGGALRHARGRRPRTNIRAEAVYTH